MANWMKGSVVENRQWTDELFSLYIDVPLAEFKAGQFVRIALDIDGEQVARPYSLVNAPHEEQLEIYFNIVPEGPLSPGLAALKAGDEVRVVDKASGFLTIGEVPEVDHLWLMATGTGIGPFLSCLKTDEPWQRFRKIVLGYSVRFAEELSYTETISRLLKEHPGQMEFVPFVTREEMDGAFNSRITTNIENGELEKRVGIPLEPETSHIMMCGNSAMIQGVSDLLQSRGMRRHRRREPGHITTEKYH